MTLIDVYPDWCSTGLWGEHRGRQRVSLNPEQFEGIVPHTMMLALRWWHCSWEMSSGTDGFTPYYRSEWYEDGKYLVNSMNEHSKQHGIEFIYRAKEFR
jgi:hypothetical protein